MRRRTFIQPILFAFLVSLEAISLSSALTPGYGAEEEGFRPLFNGRDLTGWVPVNVAPETFSVKEGLIVSTGIPTGVMRTDRHYENFILELEWRHMHAGGNAGVFIWGDALTSRGVPFARGIEVQVLDGRESDSYTSHGDVFSIHGAKMIPDRPHPKGAARCLPSEKRAKPSPEWNHYRVECNQGVIKLAVNGKVVSGGSSCWPRKGYICLESEGSECHFRNLKIKELPSTDVPAAEIATLDEGFQSLYTGLDLRGWKQEPGHVGHWTATDWILNYDGKSTSQDPNLWTEKEYGDFVLICDWKLNAKPQNVKRPIILPNGDLALNSDATPQEIEVRDAGDSGIYLRGNSKSQVNIWCWPIGSGEVYGYRTDKQQSAEVRAAVTPKVKADLPPGQWNRFIITMKGDRLTVELNGKLVVENAQLPGVPPRGPIALQHHGDSVQFANIFIKEMSTR